MILVQDNNIIFINLDIKALNNKDEKYRKLLKKQIFWLNRNKDKVFIRAKNLYDDYINNKLNDRIKIRCCNFKLLEIKCKEYNDK